MLESMSRPFAACGVFVLAGCGEGAEKNRPHVESLSCNPSETWEVLNATSAGLPSLNNLGDAEFVSPEEVGDGLYHLFAGVAHEDITGANSFGAVFIHDATASDPAGTYSLPKEPIVSQRDDYDLYGIEVPSYLRYDAHTEFLYYCALNTSDEVAQKGSIAALERVDGGTWTKLGPVAPLGPGSTSQCEPDAVLDPDTGTVHLFFIADGDAPGMRHRESKDPRSFPAAGETGLSVRYSRIATSRDPFNDVYRYALDVGGYPTPLSTEQSWTTSFPPDDATLQAHAQVLHEGNHGSHPDLHVDGPTVLQSAGAGYLNENEVLFFYVGLNGQKANMRVHAQRCRHQP
jgi:hypothetical protein